MTRPAAREARAIRRRLLACALAASLALVVVALVATAALAQDDAAAQVRESVVALNEARAALAAEAEPAVADRALAEAQETLRRAADAKSSLPLALAWAVCAAGVALVWSVTAYLYLSVVRPFSRLEAFADEVARGNLDLPLAYERSNPFGRFTWAFDNMRKEIKRARAAEAEALEQSKTTVAALSHDIKTPIASIRAYSEALELGLARDETERAGYARTIARKCDEVTALTDDLFLHALAELDRIAVSCEDAPIDRAVARAAADFGVDGTVVLGRLDRAVVAHDPKRLVEALENLVANARKYAPGSTVEVNGREEGGAYRIEVRDFGDGVAPEDLPFAFDRFYRGANAQGTPGAGLGLFIVRYLVEQMGGSVRLENAEPGLRVGIEFPLEP
ncbi:HAMP domain-containing histidine kinase [Eggerthella guodeyinii]|uniref:Signal transduction histidine-protein kinase/phosphatase MprB n=1 Tax=Eggerthella guodeyinii TaxID=2690837 RepID=A0A6L7IQX5_9ACTN|nr:HAMP domain-containing sensor histidine kinase [Eggerthella guodeyinii]QOS69644.1 HAMP domain-containing histidine kinase [Eggerthella guodeyinii]